MIMNDSALPKNSYGSSHESRSGSVSNVRPPVNVLLDGYKTSLGSVQQGSEYRDSVSHSEGREMGGNPLIKCLAKATTRAMEC